jgi:O-antigen ligase
MACKSGGNSKQQFMAKKISIPAVFFSVVFFATLFFSRAFTDPFILPKYYFTIFTSSLGIVVGLLSFATRKYKLSYSLNLIDLSLISYIFYLLAHSLLSGQNPLNETKLISLLVLLGLYLVVNPFLKDDTTNINRNTAHLVIVILAAINALFGFMQYFSIYENLQSEFRLGGAYGNPGPFSNMLVVMLPYSLAMALFHRKGSQQKIALASGILILALLPLTKARTAWIAALVVVFYIVLHTQIFVTLWSKHVASVKRKLLLFATIVIILFAIAFSLSSIKQQSASGRLFIYKVGLEMVKDKPILGHGFARFPAVHNDYQADYFRVHPADWENAFLADCVNYAFNEYLQITTEVGIIGLILFLAIFVFVFFTKKVNKGSQKNYSFIAAEGSILAILVTSFFSYPLHDTGVLTFLFFGILLVSIQSDKNTILTLISNAHKRRLLATLGIVLSILFLRLTHLRIQGEKEWLSTFQIVRSGSYDAALKNYERLYEVLNYNQFFLFNYGAELVVMQKYKRSIEVLEETKDRLNDSDFYIYLGSSYEGVGEIQKAKECFEQAYRIVPIKFYPRYREILIHQNLGEMDIAYTQAKELLAIPTKVDSDIVTTIKTEMNSFVEKYEASKVY